MFVYVLPTYRSHTQVGTSPGKNWCDFQGHAVKINHAATAMKISVSTRYSISDRFLVCLSVCLLPTSRRNYWFDHFENFTTDISFVKLTGADPEGFLRGATWRAWEREPIAGVWRRSPQRGPGAELLVRGSGGAKPPWSWKPFSFCTSKGNGKFAFFPTDLLIGRTEKRKNLTENSQTTFRKFAEICG